MPATILFFSANPSDTSPLALDEEHRAIQDEKDRARLRDAFDLRPELAVRIDDVRHKLVEHRPAVVHFSGHGQAIAPEGARGQIAPVASAGPPLRGELVLKDDDGRAVPVPIEALAELFRLEGASVRCVVLNACSSLAQAEALAKHVSCVVGTATSILDAAAIAFTKGFYGELCGGGTVQRAFDAGKNAVGLAGAGDPEIYRLVGNGDFTLAQPQAAPAVTVRPANNLPARRLFVGRGDELSAIGKALAGDLDAGEAQGGHASVHGFGGVGKTALALEYAHRSLGEYPGGVWWLLAEGKPVDALGRLAPILRAHGPASMSAALPVERAAAAEIAEDVRVALQSQAAPALVLLDNVSEPGWRGLLPGEAVHVLMTSRDARLVVDDKVALGVLSTAPARDLAVKIAGAPKPGPEAEALDRVVTGELGGLAVAVEMAAHAVAEVFRSWSKYEGKLRAEMETLLEDPEWMGDYPRGVFAALDLSIDKCPPGEAPRRLLEAAAVFAADAVPLVWAQAVAQLDPAETATDKALADLRRLGLVVVDEAAETLSMQRLLWRRVRRRSDDEARRQASRRAAASVALWLEDTVDMTRIAEVHARRAHVDEVLAAAEAMGGGEDAMRIADRLATHLQQRAELAEARALFERALAAAERLEPANPGRVAMQLSNLAMLLQALGQTAEARPLLERALGLAEATPGPDHPNLTIYLSNLATSLLILGQAGEARPLVERALKIDEATYGPDHPNVAVRVANLAAVLLEVGQAAEARPLFERALRIDEATYGPEHPLVAADLSNLTALLLALGQPGDARPLAERALRIDEATYGPEHPQVAAVLSNLGSVLRDLGLRAEARPVLERALAIAEKALPPGHPWRTSIADKLKRL